MIPSFKKSKLNTFKNETIKLPMHINKNSEMRDFIDSSEVYNTEVPTEQLPLSPAEAANGPS